MEIANWIAPAATMLAAMMTASNLGARFTGWGFVVFTIGSITWSFIGMTSGQTSLLLTNAFLTLVNLFGVWRWLGRRASLNEGAEEAHDKSDIGSEVTLFRHSALVGMEVRDECGTPLGKVVDAMMECQSKILNYVIVGSGGVAGVREKLRGIPVAQLSIFDEHIGAKTTEIAFHSLPLIEADDWPTDIVAHNAKV
ncbi:PRC-barrel domain-containing protein [Erythrobacter aureus]|uniref:PRC-barrel domain-containing protein n=1 Tax=Erythrobacter aureus TaxID=2182384 RepID=UPI003A8CF87B